MWAVVQANSNDEFLAEAEIKALGIETFLPVIRKRIRHARTVSVVKRALFPRYLFARFDLDNPNWPRIFSRRGVVAMIMDGSKPKAVPPAQMAEVMKRAEEHEGIVVDSIPLKAGDLVQILDGFFATHRAIVERAEDDKSMVTVKTNILGRQTPVILPRTSVAAVI
jgi:transcriptional antiterminator RfaH